jgi:hypothetical protein
MKLKKLMKLKKVVGLTWDRWDPICGQFEVDPGWISALDFWCRFSVDFSPLFGLRRVREMPVSRDFLKLDGDLEPFLAPILGVLFIALSPS